jgi:hypothetical protein
VNVDTSIPGVLVAIITLPVVVGSITSAFCEHQVSVTQANNASSKKILFIYFNRVIKLFNFYI